MKPSFRLRQVNGIFGDPCLYVRLLREKRALLFDLGDISALSAGEISTVSDVFVTHTHIDHFIGFDTLLRACLRRETPLTVYGPPKITSCIEGKLKGYTWNLITDYPAVIRVVAFTGREIVRSVFRAANSFRREREGRVPSDGLLLHDPLFRVSAVKLNHATPCLAFSLEEEIHININKDALLRRGLSVGPWLSRFKELLRKGPRHARAKVSVAAQVYTVGELADIASMGRGQKVVYATDIAMTRMNRERLTLLAKGADDFYCEAYFLDRDSDRARQRFHLTARACGSIARAAEVARLSVIHVSPKYHDSAEEVIIEAMTAFRR